MVRLLQSSGLFASALIATFLAPSCHVTDTERGTATQDSANEDQAERGHFSDEVGDRSSIVEGLDGSRYVQETGKVAIGRDVTGMPLLDASEQVTGSVFIATETEGQEVEAFIPESQPGGRSLMLNSESSEATEEFIAAGRVLSEDGQIDLVFKKARRYEKNGVPGFAFQAKTGIYGIIKLIAATAEEIAIFEPKVLCEVPNKFSKSNSNKSKKEDLKALQSHLQLPCAVGASPKPTATPTTGDGSVGRESDLLQTLTKSLDPLPLTLTIVAEKHDPYTFSLTDSFKSPKDWVKVEVSASANRVAATNTDSNLLTLAPLPTNVVVTNPPHASDSSKWFVYVRTYAVARDNLQSHQLTDDQTAPKVVKVKKDQSKEAELLSVLPRVPTLHGILQAYQASVAAAPLAVREQHGSLQGQYCFTVYVCNSESFTSLCSVFGTEGSAANPPICLSAAASLLQVPVLD